MMAITDNKAIAWISAMRSYKDRRQLLLVMLILLGAVEATPVFGQGSRVDIRQEYNVKGAFLYSFGRYVRWPDRTFVKADSPFVIGVAGKTYLDAILTRIQSSKQVRDRQIDVKYFETVAECETCHLLFLSRTISEADQKLIIRKLKGKPVLIVGETQGFCAWGGDANFFLDGERIRFEISSEAARSSPLSFDGKLLRIAKIVDVTRD